MQAREEGVASHVGDELAQHGGTLGVGDAVEVDLDVGQVTDLGRDRVGRGQLILLEAPVLTDHEARPALGVLGGLGQSQVAHELGEGLVEPQVVPPLHGDQVAEPHVRQLVQDRVGASLHLSLGGTGTEHVSVAEGHAARVFHGTRVVFGHEDLVVLREGVGDAVGALEELEAATGDVDDLVGVQVIDDRGARVHAQVDRAAVGGSERGRGALVGAGHDRGDVRRHLFRGREAVGPRITVFLGGGGGGVGEDLPTLGDLDGESKDRLQVGLLEGRVDAARVRDLELGVGVGLAVRGIDEAVQTFAGVHVLAGRVDLEDVVLRQVVQRDAVVLVGGERVEADAVQANRVHVVGHEVRERGRAFARVKLDAGERSEVGVAAREVQRDLVACHGGDDRGALGCFLASEVQAWHGVPFRRWNGGAVAPNISMVSCVAGECAGRAEMCPLGHAFTKW